MKKKHKTKTNTIATKSLNSSVVPTINQSINQSIN